VASSLGASPVVGQNRRLTVPSSADNTSCLGTPALKTLAEYHAQAAPSAASPDSMDQAEDDGDLSDNEPEGDREKELWQSRGRLRFLQERIKSADQDAVVALMQQIKTTQQRIQNLKASLE
jgi:hypothetical protein